MVEGLPASNTAAGKRRLDEVVSEERATRQRHETQRKRNDRATGERTMRYISARQMIFDAYQEQRGSVMQYAAQIAELGAQVQTTQRSNKYWRIVNGLEAGQVISTVERQPKHMKALARYCFGPFTRDELAEDRETVEVALYRQMLSDGVKLLGQGRGKPTAQQLETLR